MRKKICKALTGWTTLLIVFAVTALWVGSRVLMTVGVLWLLFPIISTIQNFYLRNKIQVSVSVPITAAKRETVTGIVTVQNKSRIPCAGIYCEIMVKNHLTQEQELLYLEFTGTSNGQYSSRQWEIYSDHCGYLQVYPSRVWLMDWIGFLPIRCKTEGQRAETLSERTGEVILPDMFPSQVFMNLVQSEREEADNWSQTQKGNDFSEIFSLRDYVPGDSLKQIHWKLSSKKGELIVREPSLPIEKTLLFFWDKNTEKTEPVEMDAMAECAASLSQGILNLGYPFTLGWTEGCSLVFENIEKEEELLQTIPRMLKHGQEPVNRSEEYLDEFSEIASQFGKVIYLARSLSKGVEQIPCIDVTYLLCEQKSVVHDRRVKSFRAEHYQEDLAAVEL